jgi:HNH endonuclease.
MNRIRSRIPSHSYVGEKWKTNLSNKRRLVEDFRHRCAYCDDYDGFSGGSKTYHVDHFAPKSKFKELEFVYENLMYSCPYCNTAKKDKWVGYDSKISVINDEGFINPCSIEYDRHFFRDDRGNIKPLTNLGSYMYRELKLYLSRHRIIYNLDKINSQIQQLKIKKENGENTKKIDKIYNELFKAFNEYYNEFLENINNDDEL